MSIVIKRTKQNNFMLRLRMGHTNRCVVWCAEQCNDIISHLAPFISEFMEPNGGCPVCCAVAAFVQLDSRAAPRGTGHFCGSSSSPSFTPSFDPARHTRTQAFKRSRFLGGGSKHIYTRARGAGGRRTPQQQKNTPHFHTIHTFTRTPSTQMSRGSAPQASTHETQTRGEASWCTG